MTNPDPAGGQRRGPETHRLQARCQIFPVNRGKRTQTDIGPAGEVPAFLPTFRPRPHRGYEATGRQRVKQLFARGAQKGRLTFLIVHRQL